VWELAQLVLLPGLRKYCQPPVERERFKGFREYNSTPGGEEPGK